MKYVIIRDDDTCALTPIECLERLYRPFLDKNLPVCLATIPDVRSDVRYPHNNEPEGFLVAAKDVKPGNYKIGSNEKLVAYLKKNSNYEIVHHACHHEFVNGQTEFDIHDTADIARRLDHGAACLREASFPDTSTFVAPYDRLTPESYRECAKRFRTISTGWFERRRLPLEWLPGYIAHKLSGKNHWRRRSPGTPGTAGLPPGANTPNTLTLLTHPGCHLSYHHHPNEIRARIQRSVGLNHLTVLVTHWWEYFRDNTPNQPFIDTLHWTAHFLANYPDLRVIRFSEVPILPTAALG